MEDIKELTRLVIEQNKNRQINWDLQSLAEFLSLFIPNRHEELFTIMQLIRDGDMAVDNKYAIRPGELEEAFILGQKSITELRDFDAVAEFLEEQNVPTYQEYLKTLPLIGEAKPKLKSYNECKNNNIQSRGSEEIN